MLFLRTTCNLELCARLIIILYIFVSTSAHYCVLHWSQGEPGLFSLSHPKCRVIRAMESLVGGTGCFYYRMLWFQVCAKASLQATCSITCLLTRSAHDPQLEQFLVADGASSIDIKECTGDLQTMYGSRIAAITDVYNQAPSTYNAHCCIQALVITDPSIVAEVLVQNNLQKSSGEYESLTEVCFCRLTCLLIMLTHLIFQLLVLV